LSAAPIWPRPPSITTFRVVFRSYDTLVAEAAVAAADDFLHRAEIVVAHEAFDLETAVVVLVGAAVGKRDHRGDDKGAGDVGDIEALQRARRGFEREGLAEQAQGFGARIGERLSGIGALEVAGFREGLAEGEDDVAELGGFFELLFFGGGEHLGAEGFEPFAGLAFEEGAGVVHAGAVGVGRDGVFETVEFLAHVVVELPSTVGAFLRGGVAEENAKLAAHLGEGFAQ